MATQGDEELDDLENMDKTACEEKLERLQEQRERMREDTERLQEKLKALNNELAARKEEKKKISADLTQANKSTTTLSKKAAKGQSSSQDRLAMLSSGDPEQRNKTQDWIIDKVKKQVDDQLGETVAGNKKQTSDNGINIFDEMDLMVRKSEKDQAKEPKVDTVLVTFVQPNAETQYHLSFRIDETTTAKKLQEDACEYWAQSHLEYILKNTVGSKVHDEVILQNCFQDTEEFHLILTKKQPRSTVVTPDEQENILQKVGIKPKKKKKEDKDDANIGRSQPEQKFYQGMQQVPGFWEFMTQRDRGQVDHIKRIKFRTIVMYLGLAVCTLVSVFLMRTPGLEYTARFGITSTMTRAHYEPDTGAIGIAFHDVDSMHKIYQWIRSVGLTQLFNASSDLRQDNYLPGWLHIRMQHVKEPSHDACQDLAWIPGDHPCYYLYYNDDTAGKQDYFPSADQNYLKNYWDGILDGTNISKNGVDGRSLQDVPYRYQDANDNFVHRALYHTFDTSGYRVSYNLQPGYGRLPATQQALAEDLNALEAANWISPATMAVHLAFVAFNGNMDLWLSSRYSFEVTPAGIVNPKEYVDAYLPNIREFGSHNSQFILDIARMIMIAYVLIIQIPTQISLEYKEYHHTWTSYLFHSNGIADVGIVALCFSVFFIRFVLMSIMAKPTIEYTSDHSENFLEVAEEVEIFHVQILLEGVVFGLICFRLARFTIINRVNFVNWRSLSEAITVYESFLFVMVPLLFGLIALGEAAWRAYDAEYRTWWTSTATTLMQLISGKSPTHAKEDEDVRNPWAILGYSFFWTVVYKFIILNTWIAIVVTVYQKNRVRHGYRPGDDPYRWSELRYAEFLLFAPIKKLYCRLRKIDLKKADDDDY